MARRRVSTFMELDGPIWDAVDTGRVKDALAEGIVGLATEGAEITQGFVQSGGFVDTGRFMRGIGVEVQRSRGAGYATVKVVDDAAAYPSRGRPTRTLMEYGQYRGVKVRKGVYAFRKAKNRMNRIKYEGYFLPALQKVLE